LITLRYHALSIAAVFLALAVGVVLGAGGVSDRLLSSASRQADGLEGQVHTLTAERDGLVAAQRGADDFAARIGPVAVRGLLDKKKVAFVTVGAEPADRDALVKLIGDAGGSVSGELALTPAVGDPARADQLRELTSQLLPTGAQLPAASDTGSLVGGLLGGVLLGSEVDATAADSVLSGLTAAGFVVPGDQPKPADLVLVLTGGALTGIDAGDAAAVTARMAAQLDRSGGAGAVLAGRAGSADATGAVGVARADPAITADLSTVDDVQSGSGQVSAVLALREQVDGRSGRYGTAVTAADGVAPPPVSA
jgi:outer membrane murein-binding lipoprotein Lpp